MKIVAQSIVVPSMPYVHLGYLAAAYRSRAPGTKIGGGAAFTLGVGMLLLLAVCMSMSGWAPLKFVRKRARSVLCGALLFVVLGLSLVSWREKLPTYSDSVTQTHAQGYRLLNALAELRRQHKPQVRRLSEIPVGQSKKPSVDGWHYGMRMIGGDVDGVKVSCLVSAGADHFFDTEDDIRMSLDEEGEFKVAIGRGEPAATMRSAAAWRDRGAQKE